MSQLDYLAAHALSREREHNLRVALRHREAAERREATTARAPLLRPEPTRSHRLHDALVHLHLWHAPTH